MERLLRRLLLARVFATVGARFCNDTTAMLQVSVEAASVRASVGATVKGSQASDAVRQYLQELDRLSKVSRMLATAPPQCGSLDKEALTLQRLAQAAAGLRAEMQALLEAAPDCGATTLTREEGLAQAPRLAEESSTQATGLLGVGPLEAGDCPDSTQIFGLRHAGCMWPKIQLPTSTAPVQAQSPHWIHKADDDSTQLREDPERKASTPAAPVPAPSPHRIYKIDDSISTQLHEGPARNRSKLARRRERQLPSGLPSPAPPAEQLDLQERRPIWLIINFLLVAVALLIMFLLVVHCSPLRGARFESDERTNTVHLSGGISKKLVQVCLPYWLPVTSETTGYFFIFCFASLCTTSLSLGYLWLLFVLNLALWVQPDVFEHFTGSTFRPRAWMHPHLIAAAVLGALAFPIVYVVWRPQLRGRELQWSILGFKLFVMLNAQVSTVPTSFISRASSNWLIYRQADEYWHWIRVMSGITLGFAAFFTVVGSLTSKALEIKWRRFMTSYLLERYMANRAYYMLNSNSGKDTGADNPDARIQTDVSEMMGTIIGFIFSILDLIIGLINSLMLVWMILPAWTIGAVGYTLVGSFVGLWFAWQLTRLGYELQKKEADWRFSLVNIRTNAEAIAFYGGEKAELQRTNWRFEAVQEFSIRTMWWGMGFGVYHAFYDAGISLVPSIILARMYFQGKLDLGGMFQFQGAFGGFVGHLNFLLDSSGNIASVSTAVTRLGGLLERIEELQAGNGIKVAESTDGRLTVHKLTVRTPDLKVELLRNLSFSMGGPGEPKRVLVVGPSGVGKSSLMRAIAGLWDGGCGEVERPANSECMFLPQHPYMPLGSLRDQLLYPNVTEFVEREDLELEGKLGGNNAESDLELAPLLQELHLGDLPGRFVDGLDHVDDWSRLLSRGEQQRVAVVRCMLRKPAFVVLDEATSALSQDDEDVVYRRFRTLGFPYLSVGHHMGLVEYHDAVLELRGGDDWKMHTRAEYEELLKSREKLRRISSDPGQKDS